MTTSHDFSHPAMHCLADWPVLAMLAAGRTKALRLDSRAVAAIYAGAGDLAVEDMDDAERAYRAAALAAYPPRPRVPGVTDQGR